METKEIFPFTKIQAKTIRGIRLEIPAENLYLLQRKNPLSKAIRGFDRNGIPYYVTFGELKKKSRILEMSKRYSDQYGILELQLSFREIAKMDSVKRQRKAMRKALDSFRRIHRKSEREFAEPSQRILDLVKNNPEIILPNGFHLFSLPAMLESDSD